MDNAKVEFLYMHSLRALPMKTTDTVLFSFKSSQQSVPTVPISVRIAQHSL